MGLYLASTVMTLLGKHVELFVQFGSLKLRYNLFKWQHLQNGCLVSRRFRHRNSRTALPLDKCGGRAPIKTMLG